VENPTTLLGRRALGRRARVPYDAAIEKVEDGKSLLFLIKRGESNLFLAFER
jgi:hypothetical protein